MLLRKILFITFLFLSGLWGKPLHLKLDADSLIVEKPTESEAILDEKLQESLNYGYPFARWVLESWNEDSSAYHAVYRLEKGKFTELDTVIFGDFDERDRRHILRLSGDSLLGTFSAERIKSAAKRIDASAYMKTDESIELKGSALYLKAQASRLTKFDALISYQQGQTQQKNGIVGHLQLEILNLMRLGRSTELNWQRPSLNANQITVSLNQRFIWNSPFSLGGTFFQEFRDSLWVDRRLSLQTAYEWRPGHRLAFQFSQEQIFPTLSGQEAGYDASKKLRNRIMYDWHFEKSRWHFWRNWQIAYKGDAAGGLWQSEISEAVEWQPTQVGISLQFLGAMLSDQSYYEPWELFRLGGPEFLRGSYYEQYLVSRYAGLVFSIFWQEKQTRLTVFTDVAALPGISPQIQGGLGLSIPAGANALRVLVGFDSRQPWQKGKFHLIWSL